MQGQELKSGLCTQDKMREYNSQTKANYRFYESNGNNNYGLRDAFNSNYRTDEGKYESVHKLYKK